MTATTALSDVWTELDVCVDCRLGLDYEGEDDAAHLDIDPRTLALYRQRLSDNGFDPLALSPSITRLSDGYHMLTPPTDHTDAPCDGCGSTVAGERFPYDYNPDDN